jgi:hypothetical protein
MKKRPPITTRYMQDLGQPARALVAEDLMSRYRFSATEATYQNLAYDYEQLLEWEAYLAEDTVPPDLSGDLRHVRERVRREWLDFEARCVRLIPLEMAAKKTGDSEEAIDMDPATSGPDHPDRTRDFGEWIERHKRGQRPTH